MLKYKKIRILQIISQKRLKISEELLIKRQDLLQKENKIEIIRSSYNNIHFNLAIEEYLYDKKVFDSPKLLLWRNEKTVVIGRHQNPWKECDLQKMSEKQVDLARRKSGGGAVYHDINNTCFTFFNCNFTKQSILDTKQVNNHILLDALANLQVQAELQGRNDITIDQKKISGSAYQISLPDLQLRQKLLHHGTFLINTDLTQMSQFLNPNKLKLLSKGVDSVKSRVINLQSINPLINHQSLSQAIIDAYCHFYSHQNPQLQIQITNIDLNFFKDNPQANDIYNQLISQKWLYEQTPQFTNNIETRFDWGIIDLYFEVQKGIIVNGKCYSDCLFPDFIDLINNQLESQKISYSFQGIQQMIDNIKQLIETDKEQKQLQQFLDQLQNWLLKNI